MCVYKLLFSLFLLFYTIYAILLYSVHLLNLSAALPRSAPRAKTWLFGRR